MVTAKGYVLGKLWGGGEGYYPTITISGDSIEDVQAEATKALKDGTLESGMGFKQLRKPIGAYMIVITTETQLIDGKDWTHTEESDMIVGSLTDDQLVNILNTERKV